jgi:hypothetical protein
MIQRIQSLYLTFVLLLPLLFFRGGVLNFVDGSGKTIDLMLTGDLTDQEGLIIKQVANIWPITAILILTTSLSLITILLFKNRKIQLFLAILLIVMSAGLLIALSWFAFSVTNSCKLTIIPGFKMAIPALILVFSILAYRRILKDDRLVKSYDRLR